MSSISTFEAIYYYISVTQINNPEQYPEKLTKENLMKSIEKLKRLNPNIMFLLKILFYSKSGLTYLTIFLSKNFNENNLIQFIKNFLNILIQNKKSFNIFYPSFKYYNDPLFRKFYSNLTQSFENDFIKFKELYNVG